MAQATRAWRRPRRAFASLKEFFEATGTRQDDIADYLGISHGHMSNILSGKRRPSRQLAIDLSRITNVPLKTLRPALVATNSGFVGISPKDTSEFSL